MKIIGAYETRRNATSYDPIGTSARMNLPLESVRVMRDTFAIATSTFGTGAPFSSNTMPVSVPVLRLCAAAAAARSRFIASASRRVDRRCLIPLSSRQKRAGQGRDVQRLAPEVGCSGRGLGPWREYGVRNSD